MRPTDYPTLPERLIRRTMASRCLVHNLNPSLQALIYSTSSVGAVMMEAISSPRPAGNAM